jgi:DNA invertase Pin-like site-specific DNA recombinase
MKRWGIWAAVSSKKQADDDKTSIPEQIRLAQEAAAKWNGTVEDDHILVVPGVSRSIILYEDAARSIDAYAKLRELLDAKAIDVLAYYSDDRLGRKAALVMAVKSLCQEAGVVLYELKNPPYRLERGRTSDGEMLSALKAAGAEGEIYELTRRNEFGMMGRVRSGKMPSGRPPWGYVVRYRTDGTPYVDVDEDIAYWVRQIFKWYLQGASGGTIAERMNLTGVSRPGGGANWTAPGALDVLNRADRYAGYSEINKARQRRPSKRQYVRAKGNWQPIIDEETYQEYMAERKERGWNRRLADTPYLLTGVCWCEVCKKRMYVVPYRQPSASDPERTYLRLVCTGKHPNRVVSYTRVLKQMRVVIPELHKQPDMEVNKYDAASNLEADVSIKEGVIADIETQIQRAHRAYVTGNMDEGEYASWVAQLRARKAVTESELDQVRERLEQEQAKGDRIERIREIAEHGLYWMDIGGTESNRWLRSRLKAWVKDGNFHAFTI